MRGVSANEFVFSLVQAFNVPTVDLLIYPSCNGKADLIEEKVAGRRRVFNVVIVAQQSNGRNL